MQSFKEQKQEFQERMTRNVNVEKSSENFNKRKDAQLKEKERKEQLSRTIAKLEAKEQER